jgi:hypothetical protein
MELNGFWPVFLAGSFGGALAELVKWYGMRESEHFPTYARSARYWVITAIMVICGGLLATMYGTRTMMATLCVNIGASAPLIVVSLVRTVPVPPREPTRGAVRKASKSLTVDFLAGR